MAIFNSYFDITSVKVPLLHPPLKTAAPPPETLHGEAAMLAKILRRATLPDGPRPRRAMQLAKQMKMEMRAELGRC
jgi:hypothetical protein